jgi:uncharacterized protein (TIGR00290 family)
VVVAWSGGKDSALAVAALQADPGYRVVALLTTLTTGYDRVSIHGIRRSVLEAQVAALRLPLYEARIPPAATNAVYEDAFARALDDIRASQAGVRHIAFGDLFLTDVRAYREVLLARVGWTGVFPLWGRDTAVLARECVTTGYRATLCCVDTTLLDAGFAGRAYDLELLRELPASVDPCGERGEFHTCVSAGPIFRHPISVRPGERVLRDHRFQYCDLLLG